MLSATWTPAKCLDRASNEEYQTWIHSPKRLQGAFPYFKDSLGTQRFASEEELSDWPFGKDIYATWEEHRGHCAMLMRRWHRAYMGIGKPVEKMAGLSHTIHCTNMVLEGLENNRNQGFVATEFSVDFGVC